MRKNKSYPKLKPHHSIAGLLTWILLYSGTITAGEIVVHAGESLHDALRQAREWRRTGDARCAGGITIHIQPGRYYMTEPLFLRPEDSGTEASPTIIHGEEGAIICGDPRQRHTQLWPLEGMERLVGFDTERRTVTIPTPPTALWHAEDLEMVIHQRWAIAILRVKEMTPQGNVTVVTFQSPESRLEFEHPWPQPVVGGDKGNSGFLLRKTERHDGIEQLVIVDGADHVTFEGVTFEYTSWNRPLHKGHVTLQGGFPLVDAYKLQEHEGLPWDSSLENQAWVERPVSAVSIRHSHHVSVVHCRFEHLGCTALDFIDDVSDCQVSHCTFTDIGGTAIMGGSFAECPREVHRPYADLARRCERITLHGNTIHDVSNEDWGAAAISLGYVRECTVSYNHVSKANYSGICVGWGWTAHDTGMRDNRIIGNDVSDYARQLYDAGGIYTLSSQPGSVIADNLISPPYPAPYATNDRGFRIYLDARTDGYTIKNNKTYANRPEETRLIRRDDIGDNHPGSHLIFIP